MLFTELANDFCLEKKKKNTHKFSYTTSTSPTGSVYDPYYVHVYMFHVQLRIKDRVKY